MAGHPGRRHDEKDDDKQNVRAIKDDCMFSFKHLAYTNDDGDGREIYQNSQHKINDSR